MTLKIHIQDGMHRCSKCKAIKPVGDFYKDRHMKNGLDKYCKVCRKKIKKKWNDANKDKIKKYSTEYSKKHASQLAEKRVVKKRLRLLKEKTIIDNILKSGKKECLKCKKVKPLSSFYKHKCSKDGYMSACKDCKRKYKNQYRKDNPEKIRYGRKKYIQNNPKQKLRRAISGAIAKSLSKGAKAGRSWESLVGYTIDDLKYHIEKQFKPGMTWDNRGEWHIDHIVPVSAFNFESPDHDDFKRCWALKNLQPLWAKDNIQKSNNLEKHFQPRLAL